MATMLPRFITIKQYDENVYLSYRDEVGASDFGFAILTGESVFSPLVKIEVERSKTAGQDKYVHLRFCHSNKYLQRDDYLIFAKSNQPEEDTSKPSCTLFEPRFLNDQGLVYLFHVNSGGRVEKKDIYLNVYQNPDDDPNFYDQTAFYYLNWEALVKMPRSVAFKGANGMYLQGVWAEGHAYLQFQNDDPNAEQTGHEVTLMPDGHLRIKSKHFDRFWRRDPNWIWADSTDTTPSDINTLFLPIKIDDNTIALRNAGNSYFCIGLSEEGKTNCLNAHDSTITKQARIGVEELVMERKISNVTYRMEDARIYDETPYVAGSSSLTNDKDGEASMEVSITYQDEKSYTFSRSVSITAGVTTTFKTGLAFIAEGEIEVSVEINATLQWDTTTTTTTSVTATGTVPVPGRSTVTVDYVGTKGTCNIPYSYTQEDKNSTDGQIVSTEQIDGIYDGVSCYNFSFHVRATEPL